MGSFGSQLAGGPARVEVAGVLSPFAVGFRAALTDQGFARWAVAQHTHLMAHLSVWLDERGLVPQRLTGDAVSAFLVVRRAEGHRFLISRRGLVPLLDYMQKVGVIATMPAETPSGPVELLLAQYRTYLAAEQALAPLSVLKYLGTARLFLSALESPLQAALQELSAGTVTGFVMAQAASRRVWAAKSLTTALRSLLRFLHVTGYVPHGLAAAVPSVAGWRLSALPRGIGGDQVAAMLASCDRTDAMGLRDYAILSLLSRLGLRNGEVSRLELDDIGWEAGEILVRGKANRFETLPLPVDVGQALVDYLTEGRPRQVRCRRVFVIARAPYTGLSLSAVCSVVVAAGRRAGVDLVVSPHRLRHTVASDLLSRGAPLAEIGQLLRHRAEETTAIYAKLDHQALGELARPWPGAS
jgi:site-specific recombinase XerD